MITKKAAYMDDDTWENVVKVFVPSIIKINVSNVAYLFLYYYYLYIYKSPCLSLQIICR